MLKNLIKEFKYIINNEGGYYVMAAMAVASLISANEGRNAQMKAKAADARLQRAKLKRARMRGTESFVENQQRAKEAALKREIQIEENRLNAESKVDTTFAGSGISGQSVNEIDAELNASVSKNKLENKRALDTTLADTAKTYSDSISDSALQTEQIDTTRIKGSFLNDALGAVGAAASVAGIDKTGGKTTRTTQTNTNFAYNYSAPSRSYGLGSGRQRLS